MMLKELFGFDSTEAAVVPDALSGTDKQTMVDILCGAASMMRQRLHHGLEVTPFVPSPGDGNHTSRESRERGGDSGGVGAHGVINKADAVLLPD